jgi:hypothetical protein
MDSGLRQNDGGGLTRLLTAVIADGAPNEDTPAPSFWTARCAK